MDAKRHLLIVDDDPDLRDTLHEYFETNGFTVSSVATAQACAASSRTVLPTSSYGPASAGEDGLR